VDPRYLTALGFHSAYAFGATTRALAEARRTVLGGAVLAEPGEHQMVGVSSAFKSACHLLARVAPTQATVLFTGESGVGKELFANMLHRISPRKDKPFVALNCAAIPETLIESELFGVERGAFTGATVSRPGRLERADGGTLFLDEVGTLSLVSQGKLLRALQEGEIERVGGSRIVKVDVRVVAATNVDLRAEVRAGRFREDLFFRLEVFPIHLPPLRERREDIPLLLNHFLHRYSQRHGRQVRGYTHRVVKALLNYDFPGNIRELQNLVERGVINAEQGGAIDVPHMLRREQLGDEATLLSIGSGGNLASLQEAPAPPPSSLLAQLLEPGRDTISLDDVERRLIEDAVQRSAGNLAAAARLLGLTRAQLAYRLKASRRSEVA
jgi:transcriptional regulator with GAF, ATPase, and Fis domain